LNRVLSKRVLTLGAPIALQDALINVSFLIITVIVNQMGVIASASLGVVEKIIVCSYNDSTELRCRTYTENE
jgi:Na+-driven multidrug efflux pump